MPTQHRRVSAADADRGTMSPMGMFDSLHTGDRCGQVKCLSNSLADFVPGDEVTLYRRLDGADHAARAASLAATRPDLEDTAGHRAWVSAHREELDLLSIGEAQPLRDFQIAMSEGGFAQFADGRFLSWTDETSDSPYVNRFGRPCSPTSPITTSPPATQGIPEATIYRSGATRPPGIGRGTSSGFAVQALPGRAVLPSRCDPPASRLGSFQTSHPGHHDDAPDR